MHLFKVGSEDIVQLSFCLAKVDVLYRFSFNKKGVGFPSLPQKKKRVYTMQQQEPKEINVPSLGVWDVASCRISSN